MNLAKASHPFCDNILAWEPSYVKEFKDCTNQIIGSNNKLQGNKKFIQYYSMNHTGTMSIQAELEQILEDVELEPNPSKGLDQVLDFIKNQSLIKGEAKNCTRFFLKICKFTHKNLKLVNISQSNDDQTLRIPPLGFCVYYGYSRNN